MPEGGRVGFHPPTAEGGRLGLPDLSLDASGDDVVDKFGLTVKEIQYCVARRPGSKRKHLRQWERRCLPSRMTRRLSCSRILRGKKHACAPTF